MAFLDDVLGGSTDTDTGSDGPGQYDDGEAAGSGGAGVGSGFASVGDTESLWWSAAPGWLSQDANILKTFLASPAGFILGAVLSTILGGIETIIAALLDASRFVFLGSDGVPSATGTLGFADIPVFMASLLTDAGYSIGTPLIDITMQTIGSVVGVAEAAGPLAPVVLAMIIAAVAVVVAFILRKLVEVVLDLVQLGGLA